MRVSKYIGAPFCTIKIYSESSRLIVVKITVKHGEAWWSTIEKEIIFSWEIRAAARAIDGWFCITTFISKRKERWLSTIVKILMSDWRWSSENKSVSVHDESYYVWLIWFEKHEMVLSERYKSGFLLHQGGSYSLNNLNKFILISSQPRGIKLVTVNNPILTSTLLS